MASLASKVHSLPAELYNEIHELTFTKTSNTVYIDKEYRPPSTLQVDRATRAKLRKSYYGGDTIFYVPEDLIVPWLTSGAGGGFKAPSHVRVTGGPIESRPYYTTYSGAEQFYESVINRHANVLMLTRRFLRMSLDNLRFEVRGGEIALWVTASHFGGCSYFG